MPIQRPKDEALLKALGQNIAKFIKKKGFQDAEKFAWEMKIPKSSLSRIINGKNDIRITKLVTIAKALNVKIDDLIKSSSK
jgi:predicted transcriptional regulator